MKVVDLIKDRKEVFFIGEQTSVHEAARYLRERQVRAVGVLDSSKKLVGVVITVSPEVSLDECLRLMEKHSIYHLLVQEASGNYRGMISVTDLLQVIASDHKARADLLEALIFPQR